MIEPQGLLAICRFAFDAGALLLWGAGFYLAVLVSQPLQNEVWTQLATVRRIAAICIAGSVAATLPLQATILAGGSGAAFDPSVLATVVLKTDIGTAWLWQATATIMLLVVQTTPLARRIIPTAVVGLLLLASLPVSGHAAMHAGYLGLLHRASDVIHLLAGGFWIGALLPVFVILPRLGGHRRDDRAIDALISFSRAGHLAVALVIGSGVANTLLIVHGLPLDWNFSYQALLSLKIAIVAAMVCIAVVNRYVFVRRLRRRGMPAALAAATVLEIGLGLAVLAAVACFGMLEPG